MNCEYVEARLSPYLDDMLSSAERLEMTLHLRTCASCTQALAELRRNDLLLSRLPRVSPHYLSPTFEQLLLASAELPSVAHHFSPDAVAERTRTRSWRNRGRFWRSLALKRKARFLGRRAF